MSSAMEIEEKIEEKATEEAPTNDGIEEAPTNDDTEEMPINALLPDELCNQIHDTLHTTAELDSCDDSHLEYLKSSMITQLTRLKRMAEAATILAQVSQHLTDHLPKHERTGYPDIRAANRAFAEHTYFADKIKFFGMLLAECDGVTQLKDTKGADIANQFVVEIADRITNGLATQHILFMASKHRLAILLYVDSDSELIRTANTVINLVSRSTFQVGENNQEMTSDVSIGASRFDKDNPEFDFREWMKQCETGLVAAITAGSNRACLASSTANISAVSANSQPRANAHMSTASRYASKGSSIGAGAGHAVNYQLSAEALRESVKIYDKLNRLEDPIRHKLIALALTRKALDSGAHANFQNQRDNGNTLLMLACIKKIDIVLLYLCKKKSRDINCSIVNFDGNNALMVAIISGTKDELIQIIALQTKDKSVKNIEGKTAAMLAEEYKRTTIMEFVKEAPTA